MPQLRQNPSNVAPTNHRSQGGQLVAPGGENLPLRTIDLCTEAEGGIARTELRQVFANPHSEPLNLTYTFPLPADGAVAGFEVQIGDRTIHGEIEGREKARDRYDQALIEGRTAALLDEERANLFTQNLGNVPPKTELTVTIRIDQPLKWLADGKWEWRFPTVAAPRYLGSEGRVSDAGNVTIDVANGPTGTSASLELIIRDEIVDGAPDSPSHSIVTKDDRVGFGDEAVSLDRDIVVRWPVAVPTPGVSLRHARPGKGAVHSTSAYGLLTLVPPSIPTKAISRDVIVLLDTSGSMSGQPLDQAKQLVVRLIDSLTGNDRLEIVEFASSPNRWKNRPVKATVSARTEARQWVEALNVGGATEMVTAIHQALRPLKKDAVRQVVLVTDGLIGFEGEAIDSVRNTLPAGSRLHTVGVGSATHQAFLQAAARAGRGVEIEVGLDEQLDAPGERIVAATHGPTLVDVKIEGSAVETCSPARPADLMSASPVLQGVRLRAEGGELTVRARSSEGPWEMTIEVPPTDRGEGNPAVTALVGRESVADLELDFACGADRSEIDPAIEEIGLSFGIATRLTSWIAISQEPTVDVRQPVRVERIPQELPYGMSAEGLGMPELGSMNLCLEDLADTREMTTDPMPAARERSLAQRFEVPSPFRSVQRQPVSQSVGKLRRLVERLSDLVQRWTGRREELGARAEMMLHRTTEALTKLEVVLREPKMMEDSELPPNEHARETIDRLLAASSIADEKASTLRHLSDEIGLLSHELRSGADELAYLAEQAADSEDDIAFTCVGQVHESADPQSAVITFFVDHELDWNPPSHVILTREDERRRVEVEPQGTTSAGIVPKCALLRVQLNQSFDTLQGADGVLVTTSRETIWVAFEKDF